MAAELPCDACGKGRVRRVAVSGRTMAYLQVPHLEIPADVALPTCDACGAVYTDSDADAAALDEGLERAYAGAVSSKAQASLRALVMGGQRQRALEELLGLSPGYLSKLKGGKEISPALASVLTLLAADPSRVDELRASWSGQVGATVRASSAAQGPSRPMLAPVILLTARAYRGHTAAIPLLIENAGPAVPLSA